MCVRPAISLTLLKYKHVIFRAGVMHTDQAVIAALGSAYPSSCQPTNELGTSIKRWYTGSSRCRAYTSHVYIVLYEIDLSNNY